MAPRNPNEILDWIEIRELTAAYNRAFDDVDPDTFAATFTEDGVLAVAGGGQFEGHEALRGLSADRGFGFVHITCDPVITVEDDTARQVSTLILAKRQRDPAAAEFSTTGRYTDELARTDQGWRFRRRTVVLDDR